MPRKALILLLMLIGITGLLLLPVGAQQEPPIPITPGVPLRDIDPEATFIPRDECFPPQAFEVGDEAYIKPGVNLRSQPSQSSALVWNTIYENRDENGEVIDQPFNVIVVIEEGPVCSQGYNWWLVDGTGNPGWVAEGRPDKGGYWLFNPLVGRVDQRQCPTLYDLNVGDTPDLLLNARIREEPNREARTRTVVPAGTPVTIVGGPQCDENNGYLWWLVRATVVDFTYEGWMSEGQGGGFYLLPDDLPSDADGTLCAAPLSLTPGMRAAVNYREGSPKALRIAPDRESELLFTLVRNVPLIIEGGPVCSDNLNWWQVRVLSSAPVIGWMAEGSPNVGYWISEVSADEFRGIRTYEENDNDESQGIRPREREEDDSADNE